MYACVLIWVDRCRYLPAFASRARRDTPCTPVPAPAPGREGVHRMSEDYSPLHAQAPVDGNLHVTLREYAPGAGSEDRRAAPSLGTVPTELVLFAASSPRELLAKAD